MFFGISNWPYNTENQTDAYRFIEQFLPETYYLNVLVATFLVFINAAQINNIVIRNRIAKDINLFPGMVFIILSSLHKDMFWVSPQLISITFLLGGVGNIMRIYQKPNSSGYIFNTGFFVGLATIFYPPNFLFLIFGIISILVLRKFDLREIIQLFVGFILVFFFVAFIRYWNDLDFNVFANYLSKTDLSFSPLVLRLNEWIIILIGVLLLLTSMTNYRKFTIKKSIQSQKKVNLIYWFMVIAIITLPFLSTTFLFPSLLVLNISFSVFISLYK